MNTILLDGDIWLHRACSVSTTSAEFDDVATWNVNLKHAEAWFKDQLTKLRARLDAKTVIVALGDRNANFRKQLYPGYKAHRTSPKPPGFLEFQARIMKRCKVVWEPRLEGDDILGLLATKEPTDGKIIVSIDKDLRQIPGRLYNPDHDELEEIGADAAELLHLTQTLTGDRVDGYPGCPGVGPVKAGKILYGAGAERWQAVVEAFQKTVPQTDDDAGTPALWARAEEAALLQARLAFILRQGYYNRETKEVKLWTP